MHRRDFLEAVAAALGLAPLVLDLDEEQQPAEIKKPAKFFTVAELGEMLACKTMRTWDFVPAEGDTIREKFGTIFAEIEKASDYRRIAMRGPRQIQPQWGRQGEWVLYKQKQHKPVFHTPPLPKPAWLVCPPNLAWAIASFHDNFQPDDRYDAHGQGAQQIGVLHPSTLLKDWWCLYECPDLPNAVLIGGGRKRLGPECYATVWVQNWPL